jgi:acyl-CoA reductase-like NAD-dependent aldehyde dehydrogenase
VRCATERVLVHERVHDEFLDEVVEAAAAWQLGDPFDDKTLVGPMNNEPTASKMAHEPVGGASGTQSGWGRIGGRYTCST